MLLLMVVRHRVQHEGEYYKYFVAFAKKRDKHKHFYITEAENPESGKVIATIKKEGLSNS